MGVWVDDAEPMLTVPEIARRLGVSETTVHNWRRAYREQIPSAIGTDGYQRYSLSRFREIAALRERKLPAPAIRAALAAGEAEPTAPASDPTVAVLERIAAALERIADHLEGQRKEGID